MYRLLIVDDEPYIVEGLAQLLQESEPGLDVWKAFSAVEALGIIRKTKVDIIISDIRMPEKSGLQLIDDLKDYWPSSKVILLTGYDEFEYVYSAIQKHAEHYVLKTEEDAVLLEAVRQCMRAIEEEARQRGMVERASRQMARMGPLLKKELYEALLFGENVSGVGGDEQLERESLQLDKGMPVLLLACRVDNGQADLSYGDKLNVYYSIQNLVSEQLMATIRNESFVFEHSLIVWFIQPHATEERFVKGGEIDWNSLTVYLKGVLESVQNAFGEWSDAGVCFVIARAARPMDELHREFELMRSYMLKRHSSSRSLSVVDLSLSDGIWTDSGGVSVANAYRYKKDLAKLEASLNEGDAAEFEARCRQLIADIRQQMSEHYLTGVERYYALLLVFLNVLNAADMMEQATNHLHLEHMTIMEIPQDWEAASERMIQLGQWICACKRRLREQEGDALIRSVHDYVKDNLHSDLSLVRIAEAMFFNPSYLSRYYKQHTGRNLSEYIYAAKLDAARKLLADPNLKVNEIAGRLGFNTPSYFTIFFRKMTGHTPQEYREQLARTQWKSTE